MAGDTVALKLVLDRLLPKGRAIRLDLPLRTLEDLDQASETVRQALAQGHDHARRGGRADEPAGGAAAADRDHRARAAAGRAGSRGAGAMSREGRHRRLARLERARAGKEQRLRVVEHWPGDPAPEAAPGELLVVVRRFAERPPPAPAAEPGQEATA